MGKLIYWGNVLVALLLVISFVLPYLPPSTFPTLSILSLAVSPLLFINILFALYWLLRLRKQVWVSLIVLIIAFFHFNPFFEISSEGDASKYNTTLSVLSYNVRLFNAYEKENNADAVSQKMNEILSADDPDMLFIQEYYADHKVDFSKYPHTFIHFQDSDHNLGHAIFSKYPLLNKGGFDFEKSYNNSIYADAVVGNDTIRVYNLHLQSIGILPTVDFLQDRGTEQLKERFSERFVQQESQMRKILGHKEQSPYPVILAGDFNNTSFSYVYRKLKKEMQDAFLERGNGLGSTYSFQGYPMRIDYIMASKGMDVIRFKTLDETFSDHYPISAQLGWGER
ncbi:endonuclease/exonuclease/phosphatase family protein [Aureisphaera galaxeae]|nr:endonuclease/exonuclease/phosphatase family protein [Aureisphaera galaxeae]